MKQTLNRNMFFLDGMVVLAKPEVLDSLTPGMLTGQGVFETMRAYQGKIFAASEHLSRLKAGLRQLGITVPYSAGKLKVYLRITLESNKLSNARVRLTVWKEGSRLRIAIVALPYKPYSSRAYQKGFKITVSDVVCDEGTRETRIKSIDYGAFLSAYQKAFRRGFDEALVLNRRGDIVEGSRSNIFWVKNGLLMTPALACGCLKGITRQKVLGLSRQLKINVRQKQGKLEELLEAEEIFVTNSIIEIMPVTMLDRRRIGSGRPGQMSRLLMKEYRSLVVKAVNL